MTEMRKIPNRASFGFGVLDFDVRILAFALRLERFERLEQLERFYQGSVSW
jgi:hypothetical protein